MPRRAAWGHGGPAPQGPRAVQRPGGSGLLLSFEGFYGDVRDQLCKECWAMVQDRDVAERRETWNRLPELLGITMDGWGRC